MLPQKGQVSPRSGYARQDLGIQYLAVAQPDCDSGKWLGRAVTQRRRLAMSIQPARDSAHGQGG